MNDAPPRTKRPRRIFVLGTDTGVGKTRVTVALVHAARRRGLSAVAFKPAVSGAPGPQDDLEQLRMAMDPPASREEICAHSFAAPLAPGIAEDPRAFIEPANAQPSNTAIEAARQKLEQLETQRAAELSFIEGAGGLRVPMPGATWLDAWPPHFEAQVLLVGRLGLGTLNHTLLSLEALDRRGLTCVGFILSTTQPVDATLDPSTRDNLAVLEAHAGVPCLGVLPHAHDPRDDSWLRRLP